MLTALVLACAPGNGEVLADFALEDMNATSATFSQQVGPGDQADLVSAWYFGHST
jgi:hypothetical protein